MKTALILLILSYVSSAQQLLVWNAARSRVAANTGNAKILCIGDSTTRGIGATGTPTAYPAALSGLLQGVRANFNSWYGGSNQVMQDTRVTIGAGWGFSVNTSMGGVQITASSATSSLSFTPTGNVDTFQFWHVRAPGNGTISYQVDSGATTNLDDNGSLAALSVTITGLSQATHIIKFDWVSGGNIYVLGTEASNSTSSSVDVINAGWGGSKVADWIANTGSPADPSQMIARIAPDLILIDLGINDWSTGTPVGTYQAQMQTLLTTAIASGANVVIVTPVPSSTGIAPQITQQSFVTAMLVLGVSNSLLVINEFAKIGTWTAGNALGLYADNQHPNDAGYAQFAQVINRAISAASSISGKTIVTGKVVIQ